MKKLAVVSVVIMVCLIFAGAALAASKSAGAAHRNTGCGLGTMLFKNNADDSVVLQTFQATTNGTFAAQLFGITSGTSECEKPAKFVKNERVNEFVVANMDNLARDIAMGKGETLEAFADLLQVPADARAEFYHRLQSSFAKIFSSENVVLANVLDSVATVSAN